MADQRPLWLLDIDGVVNALGVTVPDVWRRRDWVRRIIVTEIPERGTMTLPILAARPVLDFIRSVHQRGTVEIRWHSTWRTAAVTAFAPALGLPMTIPISVAPEWSDPPSVGWWKLPTAQRAIATGRRLVWTDDDLRVFRAETADLAVRADALLIGPAGQTGLTPRHLERIAAFLRS